MMHLRLCALLAALFFIAGCATMEGRKSFDQGRALIEAGNVEQGLALVKTASEREPKNMEYRSYYIRTRDALVQRYLVTGENARSVNAFDQAEQAFTQALALEPTNTRARAGLDTLRLDRKHREMLQQAEASFKKGDLDGARARAREILVENSNHRGARELTRRIDARKAKATPARMTAALRKPVTLRFHEASVRSVFDLISQHSGLNFIFDRDVQTDLRTTFSLKDTSVEDVIRFVLETNQLERKVLNDHTLLIYPNTPAKARDYQELVMKSFYLENADAKETANMIKTLVKTRDVYVDEKLNLLIMRDTHEAVRTAERLVANQDLTEPEVMLELEVMEVSTSLLQDLGIEWPGRVSATLQGAGGVPGQVGLEEWFSKDLVQLNFSDPLVALNLRKQDDSTKVLANPRIRVKNRGKAKVHIGDKVPVITTTSTATGFASESVSYLDVGLKLEVEPRVYLEGDVGINVGLEVSNISREIRNTATGSITYQVGTRNAATILRLHDGETQVLAGLINDEDRRSAAKVPGLGDVPVLGRLFSSHSDTNNKTEIVLLITPRVVRNLVRPSDARLEEFSSGTEANVGGAALGTPSVGAEEPAPAPAPRDPGLPPPAGNRDPAMQTAPDQPTR
jgi:general secretion pathway protein D